MPSPSLNPPKLYLNEHLSPRLAVQLRRYGFDAVSTQEANMLSQDDEHQFARAVSEQRAIVTFNFSDFADLHEQYLASGKEHFGIILSTAETVAVLLHRLLRLLNSLSDADLKNRIYWLNEYK
jgi:predicted nuclease of predicted toxin-antitoxin system